tara:strand:+ start:554 stop:880 length:327 start_codon:yes stop_codon:yes gene_type:complete
MSKGALSRYRERQRRKLELQEQSKQDYKINIPSEPTSNNQTRDRTYYYKDPNDANRFKTITLLWNPYKNGWNRPLISNFVVGIPTDEMKPIPPALLRSIMSMQDQIPF